MRLTRLNYVNNTVMFMHSAYIVLLVVLFLEFFSLIE